MSWVDYLSNLKSHDDYLTCDSLKVTEKVLIHGDMKPYQLFVEESFRPPKHIIESFPQVIHINREEFAQVKGRHFHKGLISLFEKKEVKDIESLDATEGPFVILNGVTSPENVGSITRTIAALGFKSLIFDSKSCSPLLRRCIRVSMGNFVFLKIYTTSKLEELLTSTTRSIYATANDEGAIELKNWQPEKESGFIIGSEGHGIDSSIKEACKATVKIPIKKEVQHLNAGHSCAIIASRYL